MNPPPPPPPPPPPRPGVGWLPPQPGSGGPRLDVGSILGRTLDTYGREWSLFLALALPAGIGNLLQVLLEPASLPAGGSDLASTVDPQVLAGEIGQFLLAFAVSLVLSWVTALATIVATDRLWSGRPTGLREAIAGAARVAPRAFAVWLLMAAVVVGTVLLASAVGALLFVLLPALGIAVLTVVFLALLAVFIVVAIRLSLVVPVVALEETGIAAAFRRTWALTRGHAILLFATSLLVGLSGAFALWGSSLISSFAGDPLLGALATGIATVVASPLGAIWTVIAWGDLAGGRHADSTIMARGRGRTTAIALVIGFGLVLLVAGFAVMGNATGVASLR